MVDMDTPDILDTMAAPIHIPGIIIILPITPVHTARRIMVPLTSTRDMASGGMVAVVALGIVEAVGVGIVEAVGVVGAVDMAVLGMVVVVIDFFNIIKYFLR